MAMKDASSPIYGKGKKKQEENTNPGPYAVESYNPEIYSPGSFGYSPFSYQKFSYTPYQEKESFTPSQYTSQYANLIENAKNSILNRGEFEYNHLDDPAYQAYAKQYELGGRQAMKDTLGQVAARTGGVASSYAQAAGQQQYQNYMAQLAAKIPELRQLAYSMWRDQGNELYNQFNMLQGLDDTAYGRWYNEENDRYNRYSNDRAFDYNRWSDQTNLDYKKWSDETNLDLQNWNNMMEYAYKNFLLQEQAKQDAVNARNSAAQWNIQNRNAAAQAAYENALKQLMTGEPTNPNTGAGNVSVSDLFSGYNPNQYNTKQNGNGSIPKLYDSISQNEVSDMFGGGSRYDAEMRGDKSAVVRNTVQSMLSAGNFSAARQYVAEARDNNLIPRSVYNTLMNDIGNRYNKQGGR